MIGRNAGGTKELITHGHNGWLYDNGYQELAQAMRTIMDDAELRDTLANQGWQMARARFIKSRSTLEFRQLLVDLCCPNGSVAGDVLSK